MSTHRRTWQKREQAAAKMFGCQRQRLSGSSGRADCSGSDSTHPRLFIETKTKSSASMISLFDSTQEIAKRENKIPILMLAKKNRPGFVVVCRSRDLRKIAAELTDDDPFTTAEIPHMPKSIASDDADLSTPSLFPGDNLE